MQPCLNVTDYLTIFVTDLYLIILTLPKNTTYNGLNFSNAKLIAQAWFGSYLVKIEHKSIGQPYEITIDDRASQKLIDNFKKSFNQFLIIPIKFLDRK